MNYATRSTNFDGRAGAAAIGKPLSTFKARTRNKRSDFSESQGHEVANVATTQSGVVGRKAFEEMFVASRPKFVAMACGILRSREDAEDAVQNAFLSGYLHLRSFEGRSALKTWFTRIVLNAALMMQRKRKISRIQPFPESSDSREFNWTENIPAPEPDPEMIHAERETLHLIDGILGELKPTLRQAFTMTYYDGLSRSEASAVLGVSGGTFKARVFRARRRVLDQTERPLGAPSRRAAISVSKLFRYDDSAVARY